MSSVPQSAILTATIPGINGMWAQLLHLAARQEHGRGNYLYLYDDPKHSFYYLERGRITILHGAANGQIQNMLYMQPGTLINVAYALGSSMTSFLDSGCQFYCLTDVTLWKFPGELLHDRQFIRDHPDFVENLMSSMGLKLLLMHNTLSNSGTGNALTRLCRFCLNMSQADNNALELSPGISQRELANLLGVHRISLLRSIQKLKRDGVLKELTRDRLIISDLKALRELAMQ
ncbi:Crp/Fnr family transcriptional regulator [Mailhella massiliensis]|uniref:Crp/Fnr family transcriptional regulator n=1 Tax=Mailhella massiliensis TaxID=1903261 RepID=A0A921AWH8_9BACT|nr:Crp/Fnr family transcriptional regulator [Mailhella massiliensis]HJD97647.1 Crp/Fnr family transcriptional regulator [Mailhella massiliensis]